MFGEADTCHPVIAQPQPRRHRPRRRAIQYSRGHNGIRIGRGVLDSPPSRGMTAVCWALSLCRPLLSGRHCTSICSPSFWMMPANFFVSASTKSANCCGVP
ncbi:hypothetical protein WN72_28000 [Bradyrhizobium arachidis]|uniref:Uncharacterized protein n=1 Tax=Bradyrhizobium arachidis TaxID=858423 RepID=A0AAE7NPM5_9BRAD|nr:hypothetical protein WN72_28000 [Bradyrhizobium arachidis]